VPKSQKQYQADWRAAHPEHKEQSRLYRIANRDARNESQRVYRAANVDTITDKRLRIEYGITLVEWRALFESQGNCCALCGSDSPGNGKANWHTDHCHATGKVRGILCHNCNVLLGHAKESIAVLKRAVVYLIGGVV
jgi:hypothetical protein